MFSVRRVWWAILASDLCVRCASQCMANCNSCPDGPDLCYRCNAEYVVGRLDRLCVPCPVNCATCARATGTDNAYCTVCKAGYDLTAQGICCGPNCQACNLDRTCATCNAGYYRQTSAPFQCEACSSCQPGQIVTNWCLNNINTGCYSCLNGDIPAYALFSITGFCRQCDPGTYKAADKISCAQCTTCLSTQYVKPEDVCAATKNTICTNCPDNKAVRTLNSGTCDTCTTGYYALGSPFSCFKCDLNPCSVGFYQECSNAQRTCTQCAGLTLATACPVGQGPEPKTCPLGTTSGTKSVCTACAAGSERLTAGAPLDCAKCGAGFYKDVRGVSSCGRCTNAPANNSLYMIWGNTEATIASCPWGCNAGYYKKAAAGALPNQCLSCAATAGTFMNTSGDLTACYSCTNRGDVNGYYLRPVAGVVGGFDGKTNACPWECNAGYVRVGSLCNPCGAGTYRVSASNVANEGQVNTCGACTGCASLVNYESLSCTPTRNRVCTACRVSCSTGQYKLSACNVTTDLVCASCATRCNAGYYRTAASRCDGTTDYDSFLRGCVRCKQPGDCSPGYYISPGACAGSETVSNQCQLCAVVPPTGDCLPSQYRGGCFNYTNTVCVNFTRCQAGQFLAEESRSQDGVCRACTNCTALGLAFLRQCTTYDDAVCKGSPCNLSAPCVTPAALASRGRLACDYSGGGLTSAFCGMCPLGYGSDGQFCLDCPRGSTCNRIGVPECQGQCARGRRGVCDDDFMGGYVSCQGASCVSTVLGVNRVVSRGPYIRAEDGACEPYFQCSAGYYKVFRSTGVAECEACAGSLPSKGLLDQWVTEGLSIGDGLSCLWDCKAGVAMLNASRTGCTLLSGRALGSGQNLAGWWKPISGNGITGQCAYGTTSEPGMALNATDCVACPAVPWGAARIWNSVVCDWKCEAYGAVRRGGVCVAPVSTCAGLRGYTRRSATDLGAGCVATAFPWNRGGFKKTGWAAPLVVVAGGGGWADAVIRPQSGLVQDGLAVNSLRYGVSGRHSVVVMVGDGTNTTRSVEGPLCSATRLTVGAYDYVIGAVCNQSFLAYLNLSDTSARPARGLGVLIGLPGRPGFRNGFRREAQFESELYVASGPSRNGTAVVYVLDRWNCLVREVVLSGQPGGYLTRAYTVGGDDSTLALGSLPKCVGGGALAWPRKFWALLGGWLAFADEGGLWQFHTETRELLVMAQEGDVGFEADDLLDVDAGEFTVRLVFGGVTNATWLVSAQQDRCPDDWTSVDGGDCTVECPWLSSGLAPTRFVNQTTGACAACTARQCGYGEVFSSCARDLDSRCVGCSGALAIGAGWVFAKAGTCAQTEWKRAPPCEPGSYAMDGGRFCEACPRFTGTWRGGATDVRQCKCLWGLARRGGVGRCVGAGLFEYEGLAGEGSAVACVGAGSCGAAPANATWMMAGGGVACSVACNAGFYRDTGAGWLDQCRPCLGPATGQNYSWSTRGDDNERWSCEWDPLK